MGRGGEEDVWVRGATSRAGVMAVVTPRRPPLTQTPDSAVPHRVAGGRCRLGAGGVAWRGVAWVSGGREGESGHAYFIKPSSTEPLPKRDRALT